MSASILFSDDIEPLTWSEARSITSQYGPKGATLTTIPRAWTPPFALFDAQTIGGVDRCVQNLRAIDASIFTRLRLLANSNSTLLIRSSVVGETIWDRGSYRSEPLDVSGEGFEERFIEAAKNVIASAEGKQIGLVIQRLITAKSSGEFGNLLRISKTRDHWELSSIFKDGTQTRIRFNTQRDQAASSAHAIEIRSGVGRERLFGSIAAWINNELVRGQATRVTCEWVTDNKHLYLVQIDQEDEDVDGINPFQIRVSPVHRPDVTNPGSFLKLADSAALQTWDKLKALEELWEPDAAHKPTLFYMPLSVLPEIASPEVRASLEQDFRMLIGPDNVIVRTSVKATSEKVPNLPRTECVEPSEAADWCLAERAKLGRDKFQSDDLAFIAHRFVPAPAAAWVRAEPDNPMVEVHSLWGLPDALQYCPYDIWEVHVPTFTTTDYPDYKSNILVPRPNGGWKYTRVKNELARALSIGRREAIDVAVRTAEIAKRLGRPCHVMWFIGCLDWENTQFNLPWYWTEAHEAEKNIDRSSYRIYKIQNISDLDTFVKCPGIRTRQALELSPVDLDLMRDSEFIETVGKAARDSGVPVILERFRFNLAHIPRRRRSWRIHRA